MTDSTRPPNKPPTAPPPSGPPKVPTKADDLFALADAVFGPQTPARRDPMEARSGLPSAVATTGGPVKPDSEGGHAGSPPASGVVSGFALPLPLGPPAFRNQLFLLARVAWLIPLIVAALTPPA